MAGPWENFDVSFGMLVMAWTVVLGGVVLVFIRAISRMTVGLFFDSPEIRQQQRQARGIVGSGLDLVGVWVSQLLSLFVHGLVIVISLLSYFVTLLLLAATLHLLYLYFPIVLGNITATWNSTVGDWWTRYVIGLLEALRMGFEKVIGLYNLTVFLVFKIPFNLVLHMIANGLGDIIGFGGDIGAAGRAVYASFAEYDEATRATCGQSIGLGNVVRDISCFRADLREVDLVTPLSHVNKAMAHLFDFIPRTCTVLAQPVVVLLFPLVDIELSKALHFLFNAIQYVVVQMPLLSANRYSLAKDIDGLREFVLAVPDAGPAFDYVAAMFVHAGRVVDNWLDVALYTMATLGDPQKALDCDAQKGSWAIQSVTRLLAQTFGNNKTVLVQLTPTMFAVTDGYNIEYHHHGSRTGTRIQTEAWMVPINITYGVAAVAYARDMSRDENTGGHTTALLGCGCTDDITKGIQVTCAIAPYDVFEGVRRSAFVMGLVWEVANTPRFMACRDTKIAVESIRYQAQRLTTPGELRFYPAVGTPVNCMTKGTCTRIDAAIWIMPVCHLADKASNGAATGNTACIRGLRDFSCFPFCLGVHRTFSANENIIVRSASAWENNVMLTSRDCVLENTETFKPESSRILESVQLNTPGTWVPSSRIQNVRNVQIRVKDNENIDCRVQQEAISSVPVLVEDLFTSSQQFQELHRFEAGWEHANDEPGDLYRFTPTDAILSETQPFVFAGDMAVRTVTVCRDGRYWGHADPRFRGDDSNCRTVVDVLQITGNEFNEFTLRHIVPGGIPVTRRPVTQAQTETVLTPGRVTLPPVVVRSVYLHNPATTSFGAIWYAVNPDYEMLHCILRYCTESSSLVGCLQFSVLSNYDSIRIWKVIPQSGCVRNPVTGEPECPPQTAQSVKIDDAFAMRITTSSDFDVAEFCNAEQERNLYVEDMEQFDYLNIAVAMRRGNMPGLYDDVWGGAGTTDTQPVSRTVYYFVNTQTLEVREDRPWVDALKTRVDSGYVCSDLRIAPRLGSAVGEALASATFLWKTGVTLALNVQSLVWLYEDPTQRCTIAARALHHSFFEDCGTGYIDLTDSFEAINRANIYAWEILEFMGNVIEAFVDNEGAQALGTFLRGARMYSENRVLLSKTAIMDRTQELGMANAQSFSFMWGGGGSSEGGSASFATVLQIGNPRFMAGMSVGVAPIAYAEYAWRVWARMLDRIIVVARLNPHGGGATFVHVLGNMTNVWYESIHTDWEDIVANRARRMCTGASLMVGYTNPWARFVLHWCLAGVEFTSGSMQALGGFVAEMPMAVCVCVRATDHDFSSFLRDVCVPETAATLRPLLVNMLAWQEDIVSGGNMQAQSVMQTVCSQTMDALEDSIHNTFSQWALEHTEAGMATMSLFDYVGVLMQQDSAQCANFESNPLVSVILPTPIDYFRTCASTAICRVRCKPYSDALQRAKDRMTGIDTLPPISFRTNVESSMFRQFQWGDFEDTYMRLFVMSEVPVIHDDCGKCNPANADCVSVVGLKYGQDSNELVSKLTVRSFCVPMTLHERVHMAGEWEISDDSSGNTGIAVADMLDPDDATARLLRVAYSLPFADHVITLARTRSFVTSSDLFFSESFEQIAAWRSSMQLRYAQIANSGTIADQCLDVISGTIDTEDYLNHEIVNDDTRINGRGTITVVVNSVKIVDFISLAAGEYTVDMLVQLDVNVKIVEQFNDQTSEATTLSTVFVRLGWCEYLPSNFAGSRRLPGPLRCDNVRQNTLTCLRVDNAQTRTLFNHWLQRGNIVYMPWKSPPVHVWVPAKTVTGSATHSSILLFDLRFEQNVLEVVTDEPLYALNGGIETNKALGNRPYRASMDLQGLQPRSFEALRMSVIAHYRKEVDQDLNYDSNAPGFGLWYACASNVVARAWLRDTRYDPRMLTLRSLSSRKRSVQVEVDRYCNGYSCGGCSTLQLRQLCASLQMCITSQCIGSTVNHGSGLCNAGMMLEALYSEAVSVYVSAWYIFASVVMSIVRGTNTASVPYEARVDWISNAAYTVMCETKDIIAAFTSILATMIQTGVNSQEVIRPDVVPYGVQTTRVVNTDAYAENALQIAAFHQFLYQLFLGPLYYVMGYYRWGFCFVNNVVSSLGGEEVLVSLGDMDTTENGATWGACSPEVAVSQILSATANPSFFANIGMLIMDAYEEPDHIPELLTSEQKSTVTGLIPSSMPSARRGVADSFIDDDGNAFDATDSEGNRADLSRDSQGTLVDADGVSVEPDSDANNRNTGGSAADSDSASNQNNANTGAGAADSDSASNQNNANTGASAADSDSASNQNNANTGASAADSDSTRNQNNANTGDSAADSDSTSNRNNRNSGDSAADSDSTSNRNNRNSGDSASDTDETRDRNNRNKAKSGQRLRPPKPIELVMHIFDAMMSWVVGVLTGVQDIIYNFDQADCRVVDITVRDAVQCACGDTPAYVIPAHRGASVSEGAFWCVGILYLALDDGTFGYVYNPFSLSELGEKLAGMDTYLECISDGGSVTCVRPSIPHFDAAHINAMSVLTRCRANYMQRQWDIGAHALFDPAFELKHADYAGYPLAAARTDALAWAAEVGADVLNCVVAYAPTAEEFPSCLAEFLRLAAVVYEQFENITIGTRSESYFAYKTGRDGEEPANPDACLVYTGPAALAASEETRQRFAACTGDSTIVNDQCELPVLAWTGNLFSRVPVANVHREAIVSQELRRQIADELYMEAQRNINDTFDGIDYAQLAEIDTLFFSSEGDALHQMMDCMFMGPYARVDYLIADPEGALPTLAWFRDSEGGKSRAFDLPCSGDKLRGDSGGSPFTCGSAARRAIIKQYVRNEFLAEADASNRTAKLIMQTLANISAEWLNPDNYGCRDPLGGPPAFEFCGHPLRGGNGYDPSLTNSEFWKVPAEDVLAEVTGGLPGFYRDVMTDATKWMAFYQDDVTTEMWGAWNGSDIAKELHLFAPHEPVVSYSDTEAMHVLAGNQLKNSMWGVCTALLSQPMLTLPLVRYDDDGTGDEHGTETPAWMPRFVREEPLGAFNPYANSAENPDARDKWMERLLHEAWEHSPMYMHYVTRYVPSVSSVCESAHRGNIDDRGIPARTSEGKYRHRLRFSDVHIIHAAGSNASSTLLGLEDVDIPFLGFTAATLGSVGEYCPCSRKRVETNENGLAQVICSFSIENCDTFVANYASLQPNATLEVVAICTDGGRTFFVDDAPRVQMELALLGWNASCPEFQVTDQWGFFPYREGAHAFNQEWVVDGDTVASGGETVVDSAQLLLHMRAGVTPANLLHVLRSFEGGGNPAVGPHRRLHPLRDAFGGNVSQPLCSGTDGKLAYADGDLLNLVNDFVHSLFPVAQLVYEPSGVSACTRFVIEYVKLTFMQHVIGMRDVNQQRESTARWRERCKIKAKQTASCNALSIFDVIPARVEWTAILPNDCGFVFNHDALAEHFNQRYYVTPGCILYGDGALFNVRRCVDMALSGTTATNASNTTSWHSFRVGVQQLVPECQMHARTRSADRDSANVNIARDFNPTLLTHSEGYGVLFWGDGAQFSDVPAYREKLDKLLEREQSFEQGALRVDIAKVFLHALFKNTILPGATAEKPMQFGNDDPVACSSKGALECDASEFCDKVFDWWPEHERWHAPYGYHPTATCMAEDHAYRTFDSYMSVDREAMEMVYEHQSLRHAPMVYQWSGTSGLCRLHSVLMPLIETNTHRACTKAPVRIPNPVMPFARDDVARRRFFREEQCANHAHDVPWDTSGTAAGPQARVVGAVNSFAHVTEDGYPHIGRRIVGAQFPASPFMDASIPRAMSIDMLTGLITQKHAPLMARAGIRLEDNINTLDDPWQGCAPALEVVTCDTRDAMSCPATMLCVHGPEQPAEVGVCLARVREADGVKSKGPSCYDSNMCAANEHCLAEGHCGRVRMHLWNEAGVDMEYTSLVDETCGIDTPSEFPFTQDMRGASPWETVPDLLRAHGLCAQRHQYAYAYAMQHGTTRDEDDPRRAFRARDVVDGDTDTSERRFTWPWVQQGPSGTLLNEGRETTRTADTRLLHVYPHTCDRTFMHHEGVKVCSGVRGDRTVDQTPYTLYTVRDSRTGAELGTAPHPLNTGKALNKSYWMRTVDPFDADRVAVSADFDSLEYKARGSFAFLGGNVGAPETSYDGAVGNSKAKFVHCSTLYPCGVPTHSFGGADGARGRYLAAGGAWQELEAQDFTQCGSIGYRRGGKECTFDIALFPLVRLLVAQGSVFCADVFGVPGGLGSGAANSKLITVIQVVSDLTQPCPFGTLCCFSGSGLADVECKYRAIAVEPSADPDLMAFATYENMIAKLNNIHVFGTVAEEGVVPPWLHTADGLGSVTECIEDMVATNRLVQSQFSQHYGGAQDSSGISGLYHILRFHLQEVPWLWYYKWVYSKIIWNKQGAHVAIQNALQDWGGVIALGEAWDSRNSLDSEGVRRCNGVSCLCGSTASARNALLCLNAGLRLRRDTTITATGAQAGSATQPEWELASEARQAYFAGLRSAIRAKVAEYIEHAFGMTETDLLTFVPGCYAKASWNILRCTEAPHCALWLVKNATAREYTDGHTFDARDRQYSQFFHYHDWKEGVSTCVNMRAVINDLVASYTFVDDEFEALDSDVPSFLNENGVNGWWFPLYRVRDEPLFEDINPARLNTDYCSAGESFASIDHRTAPEETRECVFGDTAYHPLEAAADPGIGLRPLVQLTDYEGENIEFAENVLKIDVCNENENVAEQFANGETRMSCSFQDTPRDHGHDWCDWDFGPDKYMRQCTSYTSCSEISAVPEPTWMRVSPYMQCTSSPNIEERCVDTGITVSDLPLLTKHYPGPWSTEATYYWLDGNAVQDGTQSPWPAVAAEQMVLKGVWNTECPPSFIQAESLIKEPHRAFPQAQPLHGMCHRLTGPCFDGQTTVRDRLIDSSAPVGQSQCKIRRAKLPPGVAGRFFSTSAHTDQWLTEEKLPMWLHCPNNEDASVNLGIDIPFTSKSRMDKYSTDEINNPAFVSCTRQIGRPCALPTIPGDTTDAGCYIVSETDESEWFVKDNDRCTNDELGSEFGGVCTFALTLADGFFCGAGKATGNSVEPPSKSCANADDHKYLVRGQESHVRSLWKCAPCVKYSPLQYSGLMQCGFRVRNGFNVITGQNLSDTRPEGTPDAYSPADIVEAVKDYIRTEIHPRFRELHDDHAFPHLKYGESQDEPAFPGDGRVAYVRLHALNFTEDFTTWGNADPQSDDCPAALQHGDPVAKGTDCAWSGEYDVTALQRRSDLYEHDIAGLECTVDSPKAYEYSQCSSIGREPRDILREWVDSYYRTKQGTWLPVLPTGHGVEWHADRSAVANPFTLMYAAAARHSSWVHSQYILGDRVCRLNSDLSGMCANIRGDSGAHYIKHVNPWLGGEFNPDLVDRELDGIMGLDQCRRLNGEWEACCSCFPAAMCCLPSEECAEGEQPSSAPVTNTNYFADNTYKPVCAAVDFQFPSGTPVWETDPTNICLRNPFALMPQTCTHRQGVVGGGSGDPVETVAQLYHEEHVEKRRRVEDFLLDAHNTVWGGGLASTSSAYAPGQHTVLRMPDNLLYPAHFVFRIGLARSEGLRVRGMQMQLGHAGRLISDVPLRLAQSWIPNLRTGWEVESEQIRRLYPLLRGTAATATSPAWHCPLRTVAFWGKHSPGFNPLVPDPTRSDFMFANRVYCRDGVADTPLVHCLHGVHPYHAVREYEGLRDMFTTDGACFHDPYAANDVGVGPGSLPIEGGTGVEPCGFWQTLVRALKPAYIQSRVMTQASRDCSELVDWPEQRLEYRSGEADIRNGTSQAQRCALLHRVAPFMLKIKSDAPLFVNTTANTHSPGGDCHMGRATRLGADERSELRKYEHCVTVARTSTQASIRCTGEKGLGRASAADRIFVLQRELRQRPLEDVLVGPRGKRPVRCDHCDAASALPTKGPGRVNLDVPETSVGVIHRFSSEKFLAEQLWRACENTPDCAIDNTDGLWQSGRFLRMLATHPERLIRNAQPLPVSLQEDIEALPDTHAAEDTVLWNRPWVLENGGVGIGVVPKQEWTRSRYASCWKHLRDEVAGDKTETFVRSIGLCGITGSLQTFCDRMTNIYRDIERANCIASGADGCEILRSFYTPAQWFTTNKAFARETVRDFYNSESEDACAGEDDRVLNAARENEIVQANCGARNIEILKEGVQLMRLGARLIMAVFMSVAAITDNFMMIVFYTFMGRDVVPLLQNIMHHVAYIVRVMLAAIQTLFDLFLYLLTSLGGIGELLAKIFALMCQIMTILYNLLVNVLFCRFMREKMGLVLGFVDTLANGVKGAASILGFSLNISPWETFKGGVMDMMASVQCNTDDLVDLFAADSCAIPWFEESVGVGNHSFVATRCWANPSLGNLLSDENTLGCSGADTCILDGVGDGLGVCESCSATDVAEFARFGCDMQQRKCRCNVPLQTRTACITNGDCLDSVPCKLLSTFEATSYGVVDCVASCPGEPICLIDDTSGGVVGQCTCLLEPMKTHTCDAPGSITANVIPHGACLYAQSSAVANSLPAFSTSIIVQLSMLAVTPCALTANRVCHRVQSGTGAISNVIVGMKMSPLADFMQTSQRRLLWEQPASEIARAWMSVMQDIADDPHTDWNGTGVCAELVSAHRRNASQHVVIGVVDRWYLRECWKWRAVMNATVVMFNLTGVSDTALLTWGTALDALGRFDLFVDFSRHPTAYVEGLLYVFAQAENMQGFAEILRRWASIVRRWWVFTGLPWVHRYQASSALRANMSAGERKRELHTLLANVRNGSTIASQWLTNATAVGAFVDTGAPVIDWVFQTAEEMHRRSGANNSYTASKFNETPAVYMHMGVPPYMQGAVRRLMQEVKAGAFDSGWPINWNKKEIWQQQDGPVCELYDIASVGVRHAWNATDRYYREGYRSRENVSLTITDAIMRNPGLSQEQMQKRRKFVRDSQEDVPEFGILPRILNGAVDIVTSLTGVSVENVTAFFDPGVSVDEQIKQDLFTLPRILNDLTKCDVERVMICDTQPRGLVPTVIIVTFLLWVITTVLYLPSGSFTFSMVFILPMAVMWYAYGYSPTCSPMLPTCLMYDVNVALHSTFPSRILWPALLIKQEICNREGVPYVESDRGNINCFRSCASGDFRFYTWEDPLAWFLCEIDVPMCERVGVWVVSRTSLAGNFNRTVHYFADVVRFGNMHVTEAHRMCGVLTGFYIVPALLVAMWLILMVGTLLTTILTLAFKTISFLLVSSDDGEADLANDRDSEGGGDREDSDDADISTAAARGT